MPKPRCRSWLLGSLGSCLVLCACGSPAAKPDPGPNGKHRGNPLATDEDADKDGLQVEGTLGTLDEDAIQTGLAGRLGVLGSCFSKQMLKEPYLGGELKLHFRVARDGSVKSVRLGQSTVGSLAVERWRGGERGRGEVCPSAGRRGGVHLPAHLPGQGFSSDLGP